MKTYKICVSYYFTAKVSGPSGLRAAQAAAKINQAPLSGLALDGRWDLQPDLKLKIRTANEDTLKKFRGV